MRARLEAYMDQQGISRKDAVFYSHALRRSRRRAGAAIAYPVQAGSRLAMPAVWWIRSRREGLYYAIRSGDLASQVVLNDAHDVAGKALAYRDAVAREFTADLEYAATLAGRVFMGRFVFRSVPQRMVQFMQRSPRFRELMQDLFAGTQPYLSLRERLNEESQRDAAGSIHAVFPGARDSGPLARQSMNVCREIDSRKI